MAAQPGTSNTCETSACRPWRRTQSTPRTSWMVMVFADPLSGNRAKPVNASFRSGQGDTSKPARNSVCLDAGEDLTAPGGPGGTEEMLLRAASSVSADILRNPRPASVPWMSRDHPGGGTSEHTSAQNRLLLVDPVLVRAAEHRASRSVEDSAPETVPICSHENVFLARC